MPSSPAPDPDQIGLTPVGGRGTVRDVVAQVGLAIQRGDLRLGARLPVERAIAEHLGVSRMTVRRGIAQLRDAGVLESRSQRGRDSGSFVRSEAVPMELLPASVRRFDAIIDALQARRMFEPDVAQLAGRNAEEDDLRGLRQVLYGQIRAGDDVARVRELDPSFHIGIARATHNAVVVVMMQSLLERLELPRNPPAGGAGEAAATVEMHQDTIDAIASRDPPRIAQTMRRHLAMLESAWESYTGHSMPDWPPPPGEPRW